MYESEAKPVAEGEETPKFGPSGSGFLTDDISETNEGSERRPSVSPSPWDDSPMHFESRSNTTPQVGVPPVINPVIPSTKYKHPSLLASSEVGTPVALPPGIIVKTPSVAGPTLVHAAPLSSQDQTQDLPLTGPFARAFQNQGAMSPRQKESPAFSVQPPQSPRAAEILSSSAGGPSLSAPTLAPSQMSFLSVPSEALLIEPQPSTVDHPFSSALTGPSEATNLTLDGAPDTCSESAYGSCASSVVEKNPIPVLPITGTCDTSIFDFFIEPVSTPSFPFYSEEVLRHYKSVKVAIPDGALVLNDNILSEDHRAMLESVDKYMRGLQDFSLKEALTYVSETIRDLIYTILMWSQLPGDEPGYVSQQPLWDTIFSVKNKKTGKPSNLALRFLCFNTMSIEDTVGHMLAVRFWLWTRGYRALNRYEMSPFLQNKGFNIEGHNRLCQPILICRLDRLCNLALGLAPMSVESIRDALTLYGAYWFFFFRQHLYIDSLVEGMTVLVDLGDVQTENEQLTTVIGPVLQYLLYLFPLYVLSLWIVDSSNRRTPDEAVKLVLGIIDPMNDRSQLKAALQIKCLFGGGFQHFDHDISPSQRQSLYKGLQPPPVLCDLPVAFIKGPVAGSGKSGEYTLSHITVSGDFRPVFQSEQPPPILSLRTTCVTDVAAFLRSATASHSEAPLSTIQQRQAQTLLYDLMYAPTARWGPHGLVHNALEVFRLMKLNNFQKQSTIQGIITRLTEWSSAIGYPPDLRDFVSAGKNLDACVYWHGRDRKHRPVLVVRVGALAKSTDADTAIQLLLYWIYFALQYLLIPGIVDTWNVLADMEGMSSFKLPALMSHVARFTRDFPDRLARMWVYNAGFLLRPACDLIFHSPKVEYVSADSFRDQLAAHISSSQVERRYGGSAKDVQTRGKFRSVFPPRK